MINTTFYSIIVSGKTDVNAFVYCGVGKRTANVNDTTPVKLRVEEFVKKDIYRKETLEKYGYTFTFEWEIKQGRNYDLWCLGTSKNPSPVYARYNTKVYAGIA